LEKKTVTKAARDFGQPVWSNPCPSAGKTRRADMEQWLGSAAAGDKFARKNVLHGLFRWQLDLTR
ncbi:MAG TPA: hypothetical protein PLA11_17075, partial [Flavobacteriales bacterium]|nr:hypothetical protein [Flavobacteriales bacterium]